MQIKKILIIVINRKFHKNKNSPKQNTIVLEIYQKNKVQKPQNVFGDFPEDKYTQSPIFRHPKQVRLSEIRTEIYFIEMHSDFGQVVRLNFRQVCF